MTEPVAFGIAIEPSTPKRVPSLTASAGTTSTSLAHIRRIPICWMRKHLESYSRSRSPFPWKGYCWQLLGRFEASALAANDILGGTQPHQTSMRRDSLRVIATDSEGHEFRVNDNVREIEGENRKGRVLHIHQSFLAFLHNRDVPENGGVFVTRCRSLALLTPK
ncbi:hypothetical protein EV401DRAFT_1277655 [Pisolithus croceorrhizus]|nr:hypothetical protein EV401DRAFT_1277655 [Pisolithus croceorrhizus]